MQLSARNQVDGSKPDTPQGVNVANFQLGLGNLWDCLQSIGAGLWSVTAGAVNYTVANAGLTLIDASAGNVTINMPQISTAAAALTGALFQFKRVDNSVNTVTINRGGADTFDGFTALPLVGQYDFVEIRGDGASTWRLLSPNANPQRARDVIGAGVLSFRNKVRNPKMDIAQRGTAFAGLGAVSQYTLDGWLYASNGSQVVTVSQDGNSLLTTQFQNSLKVQVTTANAAPAAGSYCVLMQMMEGYLVRDLIGNPIAIQFEVSSPKAGIHCVALRNSGNDRSYVLTYSVTAANTPQLVTLPVPAGLITAGTWNWTNGIGATVTFVLMSGSTFQTAAAGAWQAGNFFATAAQVNCVDTVGNVFKVTGAQVEKGGASTPFEHRDVASELLLAYRYYQGGVLRWDGNATSGTSYSTPAAFLAAMRAAPTLNFASVQNINFPAAANPINVSATGFFDYRAASGTGVASYVSNWTATAEF